MAYNIAVDDGYAESNHAKLTDGGNLVPAGCVIELVHGDGAEPTSLEFLRRLQEAAALIGTHTDAIRATVTQNAEALRQAAAALHETDASAATDLNATTTIIDQTAADTTRQDVAASNQFLAAEAAQQLAAAPVTAPAPAPASEGATSSGYGDAAGDSAL